MKELLVFDLDGTLLNAKQQITDYTSETLRLLQANDIAYTLATGRTIHAAHHCIVGNDFPLLHAYNNGVSIWNPVSNEYLHHNHLSHDEIDTVLKAFSHQPITPFIYTVEPDGSHAVYHASPETDVCRKYIDKFVDQIGIPRKPLQTLHPGAQITNINALGLEPQVAEICEAVRAESHLVVYTGGDMYKQGFHWLDIHHVDANKGGAVTMLKAELGMDKVICFGDSDNDSSMFEIADEAYATANALDEVKALSTDIIGHHDEDGVAKFLRAYYAL
ncbi:MAG: HAD family hydrolase [Leucothrix sp.]